MNILSKQTKVWLIAAGVLVATAGLYLLTRDRESFQVFHLSEDEKSQILQNIKPEYYENKYLSLSCIGQILDATVKLTTPSYLELTKTDRKARRSVIDDLKIYAEIRDDFSKNVGDYIVKIQKEILNELRIPIQVWEDSNKFYQSQGIKELDEIHRSVPAKLRADLPSSKNLTKEELIQIIKTQTDLIMKEVDDKEKYEALETDTLKMITIAQYRIKDHIFLEFGVEDEDLLKAFKEFNYDSDIQQLLKESRQFTQKLQSAINQSQI